MSFIRAALVPELMPLVGDAVAWATFAMTCHREHAARPRPLPSARVWLPCKAIHHGHLQWLAWWLGEAYERGHTTIQDVGPTLVRHAMVCGEPRFWHLVQSFVPLTLVEWDACVRIVRKDLLHTPVRTITELLDHRQLRCLLRRGLARPPLADHLTKAHGLAQSCDVHWHFLSVAMRAGRFDRVQQFWETYTQHRTYAPFIARSCLRLVRFAPDKDAFRAWADRVWAPLARADSDSDSD